MLTKTLRTGENTNRFTIMLSAALLVAGQNAWSQVVPENFEMLVHNDTTQGAHLAAGRFDEAAAHEAKGRPTAFDTHNNRCVMLTMKGEYADAEAACNEAVAASEIESRGEVGWFGIATMRYEQAMALTNRGVLRAVSGDFEGARADFEAAIALDASKNAARGNLARLEAKATDLAAAGH
ncbi:MAG: hypothetical protein R3212_07635 [Xanthomonadales bacterium]|nr:hypothetical protein [Xanthomonadales bacterium]